MYSKKEKIKRTWAARDMSASWIPTLVSLCGNWVVYVAHLVLIIRICNKKDWEKKTYLGLATRLHLEPLPSSDLCYCCFRGCRRRCVVRHRTTSLEVWHLPWQTRKYINNLVVTHQYISTWLSGYITLITTLFPTASDYQASDKDPDRIMIDLAL